MHTISTGASTFLSINRIESSPRHLSKSRSIPTPTDRRTLGAMATLVAVPAQLVPRLHTLFSVSAFATALFAGWAAGLWEALCENAVAKWPVEWWPSVSAT